MQLRLLAFASATDVLGEAESSLSLDDASTVADLKRHLEASHPGIARLWEGMAVAVNGELAADASPLADGDEVALLPPVSGGSPEPPVLQREAIDVAAVVAEVEDDSCGAVVVFIGNVRDRHAGRPVARISYSAYKRMADARIRTICRDLESAHQGIRVVIVHRLGVIEVGEASVVIAVASPHRDSGYAASREALERLKGEVPIWKREHYADGESRWREEEALVAESPRAGA
ncbi:MAG: molybdenum cofactor biosynthesis protein MoaE [Thermoanaerobaculia bacterium]|nr:molybdenum cofactor biosynthesis protein MoaE [Thermoanaerobaculia bacterium]